MEYEKLRSLECKRRSRQQRLSGWPLVQVEGGFEVAATRFCINSYWWAWLAV
jgi:hypothetical protein